MSAINSPARMPVTRLSGSPVLIRYADDLLVVCRTKEQAEHVKARLAE
jgi:RNA-directed DNA polymerase